jgi:hypothetical protein
MKQLIMSCILLVLSHPFVFGQGIIYTSTSFAFSGSQELSSLSSLTTYKREHCRATRVGEVSLIAGGSALLGAELLDRANPQSQNLGVFLLAAVGVICIGEGVVLFTGGEIYDHVHKFRYSIITKRNQVGLAYNF